MKKFVTVWMALGLSSFSLASCGLSETAVSTAAGGASQAKQAEEAKATEARVDQQLDAAAAQAAKQREAAEQMSQ